MNAHYPLICVFLAIALVGCAPQLTQPTEIVSQTAIPPTPTVRPSPTPDSTSAIPDLSIIASPAGDMTDYHLASWTADEADELITQMEQVVLAFWDAEHRSGNSKPPYQPVWYATLDALLHFPDDPRVDRWRSKLAYYMALDGEGDAATKIYMDQIDSALNQQGIKPEQLPGWFQSGELTHDYFTQTFKLGSVPISVPGYASGYLINIGPLDPIDTPGGTCLLAVEKGGKYITYPIYNGFPGRGFIMMSRNPISCFAKDVTDDGIDEIIVDQWCCGHAGGSFITVFDTRELPLKIMPFSPLQDKQLSLWGSWIIDYPIQDKKTQIQVGEMLGFCDEYAIKNYQWNGQWFEISKGTAEFGQSSTDLFNCLGRVLYLAGELNAQDAIPILDNAFKAYSPNVQEDLEILEEFRIAKGLYYAYIGDRESAYSVFNEIANSPTVKNSEWVKPAQEFIKSYETQADLYRACSTVNNCVLYYGKYTDQECIKIRPCDYHAALQATVATAFSSVPLNKLVDKLKGSGVQIRNSGWYDFDGDRKDELWLSLIHPADTEPELWIAAEYPHGIKALFVDKISSQDIDFKQVSSDSPPVLTSFGTNQTIEIVRHPGTGEPFTVVQEEVTDHPDKEDLDKFKELQQQLYEGAAAAPIYARLLEIDQAYSTCPFEVQSEDGSIYSIYDCASYYYTLAFAAELAGKENEAISRYYEIWSEFPESPFALMAQQKIEQK